MMFIACSCSLKRAEPGKMARVPEDAEEDDEPGKRGGASAGTRSGGEEKDDKEVLEEGTFA
ncbi:hypothetical protein [Rhizobium sp. NFR03]|uniref:hypothetical protein n=1 Tax=Rhizobium sp. NFR03 TaxID=1566263 RepID=UPI001114DC79|nr:hypothetical protein [Rhizobium sp. NFR03]